MLVIINNSVVLDSEVQSCHLRLHSSETEYETVALGHVMY